MKKLLPALGILLLVCACAPRQAAVRPGAPEGQPAALWNAFITQGEQAASFSLSASLAVSSPKKSARLLASFRGNLERPLRLDLSTGMGQTFAMWREDSLGWLAVYPASNQAFTHADTKAALSRMGMPFPFSLRDLAAIACGRFGLILPAGYSGVKRTTSGYQYSLAAPSPVAAVTLDFEGNPIHLTGRGVEPWTVELAEHAPPDSGGRPLARRITVTSPGGLQAVLRVRKLELRPAPMAGQELELALPPAARHVPLDRPGEVSLPEMP